MRTLKQYTVEVIWPGRTDINQIFATSMDWSQSGMYMFYKSDLDGKNSKMIACYPIINSVIREIVEVKEETN